jgi:cyclic-di-GMP-binding protein
VKDSNLRRLSRRIYSPLPLATRATRRAVVLEQFTRTADGVLASPGIGSDERKGRDMADASFDVVSKVDRQEVDNALNQAGKELSQRFDFRGTNATIAWAGNDGVTLQADTEERVAAALEVFKEKLIKRSISLKVLDAGEPQASGKTYKISARIKQGIESDVAKKIAKLIRDEGPKGVQAQIQGDQLRVSGKKRDDLQAVQQLLRGADLDVALQFDNYR